uniref:M48_6B_AS1 n=1 Tax=Triticum aestivum TaxID=4565 RepID=A0A6M5K9F5_WHEAT|nr:M48_6B_AS1 [Triticum aestivum]
MCAPGGKIIVYTGLLDKFSTDAEIAAVLGHEVCALACKNVLYCETEYLTLGGCLYRLVTWLPVASCVILSVGCTRHCKAHRRGAHQEHVDSHAHGFPRHLYR